MMIKSVDVDVDIEDGVRMMICGMIGWNDRLLC